MPPTDSIGCSEYQGEWVVRHCMLPHQNKCPMSIPCPPLFRKVLGLKHQPFMRVLHEEDTACRLPRQLSSAPLKTTSEKWSNRPGRMCDGEAKRLGKFWPRTYLRSFTNDHCLDLPALKPKPSVFVSIEAVLQKQNFPFCRSSPSNPSSRPFHCQPPTISQRVAILN
ncbi:uncharacterized protein LACBIDRAFT_299698 [Laccaria bicolor S238N-H82]|uniref:Predicted protein n=1 Tax=Laccaria bicolor (strain S238N-H82 / ATCC MYA-4686) TaxID=486041 RepID=B0DF74_LACBS|nr:uncharacterized protein LACBIDRAFT_299698 [Laccaria bicolor S238N-H82]EDR06806.1 predicted protein [Laccaria bicolor S238N-H82]|eukprot:XP_001882653.1 predicted protein [Laccaria bicolor S238N-H82]